MLRVGIQCLFVVFIRIYVVFKCLLYYNFAKCQNVSVFNDKLKEEYKFLKQCQNSNDCVKCLTCNAEFSVEHRGRYDIVIHLQSERHKKANLAASTASIKTFF